MSAKPTIYASSTSEAVEVAWKLKRINETHEMRQRKLMEEYTIKSEAITAKVQDEQSAAFEELRVSLGVPANIWEDGKDWALNIKDIADGTVSLTHRSDPSRKDNNDCNCPICQINRYMADKDEDEDEDEDNFKQVVH